MDKPTVLVVDDEADVREMLVDVLESEGYAVATARDGTEALRQISTRRPSVVLLDLLMPDVSGLDVCDYLEGNPEARQGAAIVAMSAHRELHHRIARTSVVDRFLPKPFDMDRLLSLVSHYARVQPEMPGKA